MKECFQYLHRLPARSLRVSFVGFADQVVDITNKTSVDIRMSTTSTQLDEVVVVGYGQQSRSKITGAVTTIKSSGK